MPMPFCFFPNFQFCLNPGGEWVPSPAPPQPKDPYQTEASALEKDNITDQDCNNKNQESSNNNKDPCSCPCPKNKKAKECPPRSQEKYQIFNAKELTGKQECKCKSHKPNSRDKGKNRNMEVQLFNASNACPDLIDRICKSLQVPKPPDSCYILMPITMASKPTNAEENVKPDGKQEECNDNAKRAAKSGNNSCRPTRNCGCNTLISGKMPDKPEGTEGENKGEATANGAGSCCKPGCCCRPRCAYYYNPYTGCYYWCNNCCCRNGCCNNSCSNSCAMPAGNSNPNAAQTKGTPSTSKQGSENRMLAGDVTPFLPEVSQFYDKWLGANQYDFSNNYQQPSMPASPSPHLEMQQPQQDKVMTFRSRSPTDFNWTPV